MDRRARSSGPGRVPVRDHPEGVLTPPTLDVSGYLECLQRCRDRLPRLRILSGVELSEPHWHGHAAAELLAQGNFDRVLGSVHAVHTSDGRYLLTDDAYREWPATVVLREYLAEVTRMIEQADSFMVLAHIDYPIRAWPLANRPHDPRAFEEDYRPTLLGAAAAARNPSLQCVRRRTDQCEVLGQGGRTTKLIAAGRGSALALPHQ